MNGFLQFERFALLNVMPKAIVERSGRVSTLFGLRLFRVTSLIALCFVLGAVILPLWRLFPALYGQPVVPLHYNIHYGVDWTGEWWQIFSFPMMGVVCFVMNVSIALFFVRRDRVLTIIALAANVLITALLFAATVFVVSLNLVYA